MVEVENMIMSGMRSSLEKLWSALDSLFEEMSPADWQYPFMDRTGYLLIFRIIYPTSTDTV